MCKLTSEGYILKSGKIIPFHNCRVEYLSTQEFLELSASKASILDTLLIRETLHGIRNDMQSIIFSIENINKTRALGCPANSEEVEKIAQKLIDSQPGKVYNKFVEISKSLTVILLLIMNMILLYKQFF